MKTVRIIAGCVVLPLCAGQYWTQTVAYAYGYHAALGVPLWTFKAFYQQHSLYAPWQALVWQWQWGSRVPVLAAASVLVVVVVGVIGLRRRGGEAPPEMTGHGTTRWATKRNVKKAGLW